MNEQVQADKKAAEQRAGQAPSPEKRSDEQQEKGGPKTAAEKVQQSAEAGDTDTVDTDVLVDPYPAYDEMSLEELRSAADSRDVEINRDVEKAQLIAQLRAKVGVTAPQYDLMPLDRLRKAAAEADVELDEEFEKAHLITELRAADTHTG